MGGPPRSAACRGNGRHDRAFARRRLRRPCRDGHERWHVGIMGAEFARGGTGRGRTGGHATVQERVVEPSGGSVCAPVTDEGFGWPLISQVMFDWRG